MQQGKTIVQNTGTIKTEGLVLHLSLLFRGYSSIPATFWQLTPKCRADNLHKLHALNPKAAPQTPNKPPEELNPKP